MKAMVLAGPGRPLELRELPVPDVGPNGVLVRVRACGVGLTVVKGIADARIPFVPTHPRNETAGRIALVIDGSSAIRRGVC